MATPQQPLPATTLPATPPKALKLDTIQGDILSGLPKKTETLYFFQIKDVAKFRKDLRNLIPHIKTASQVIEDRKAIDDYKRGHHGCEGHRPALIPMVGVNIAFSHLGFKKLGIDDAKLNDSAFFAGQRVDAGQNLLDKGAGEGANFSPDWEEPFKKDIHGVIILAGDSHATVEAKLHKIKEIFGVGLGGAKDSIVEVTTVRGDARPGDQSAHEHFGYLDGISNPAIVGFDKNVPPGPAPIDAGHVLLGETGDALPRDPWMVDGSFLVFRYLFQKVPEFDDFVDRNALQLPGLTRKEGADLLGARLVGRWKSGAPLDLTPFMDDPELGPDPSKNNNFHFKAEATFQKMCPFAAHVRKTLPRDDLERLPGFSLAKNRIMRRGIQFGPEVTKAERSAKKTFHGRGLLFLAYQASIVNGFQFIQKSWVNNTGFPFGTPEVPGVDPILGQGPGRDIGITGYDPNDPKAVLKLDAEWVIPRGGEYFFSPSIKGLSDAIAASA
ncbi:Dyp-type peroxidase [Pholiota conissans]|uniref:Dyp-type peroxidase n=1 Tax=Pholiota conissans TaxID=109636 RepID=A0A9P6D5J9_9AGAR|nr:Dyp-type peroxidase [Pholiota conissans]